MERTINQILKDLMLKADCESFSVASRSGKYSIAPSNTEKRNAVFAEEVGRLVLELPEEDRKVLEGLTSEELVEYAMTNLFQGYRFRPKEPPSLRRRGPVKLSK